MERLTEQGFNFDTDFVASHLQSWSIAQGLKKLQSYEDAEEQGRLVVLPCKKGAKLFVITYDSPTGIEETKCSRVKVGSSGIVRIFAKCIYDDWGGAYYQFKPTDFGKTVFLTRQEAESVLQSKNREEKTK